MKHAPEHRINTRNSAKQNAKAAVASMVKQNYHTH